MAYRIANATRKKSLHNYDHYLDLGLRYGFLVLGCYWNFEKAHVHTIWCCKYRGLIF